MTIAKADTLSTSVTQLIEDPTARRVDARRNRERILDAARSGFSDSEVALSMAEVARRAGVGPATLYRNFANRRELLEALYVEDIDEICRAATVNPGNPPGPRFDTWLRRFYAYFVSKQPVATELLQQADADDPVFGAGYNRVIAAARPLLSAARQAGAVDPDLSLEQILDLVIAVAKIPGNNEYRAPILGKVLDALSRAP